MKTSHQKKSFVHIVFALSLIIGSFSLFSITFGLKQNESLSIEEKKQETVFNQRIPQFIPESESIIFIENKTLSEETEEIEKKYLLQQLERLGSINARSFIVGDIDTGEIIFKRKPNEIFPIASITKYMTAYTAAETMDPGELTTITRDTLKVEGNRARFKIGDVLTIRELIYPLLLVSSNDAGEIIAAHKGRIGFINTMRNLAAKLDMNNTNFADPTGLSENNYSTAEDLFIMMQSIKSKYPQIIDISRLSFKEYDNYIWTNINKAARYPEFRGGKTGYTYAARQTSIGYYQVTLSNDEVRNIAIIILQSNTRQQDTRNILDYLKRYVAYL